MLKGGVALLLRLDPNRTSDDIDIAYLDAAGQHGVALAALERALALDLGDHFSFVVLRAGPEQRDAGDETMPLRVEARIGGRRWVEFGIDLGYTEDGIPTESLLPRGDLTGLAEVDAIPAVRSLAIDLQVAHKLCAMFELHGEPPKHSSRARDLVDLAMIATQVPGIAAAQLRRHVASGQAGRLARSSLRAELPRWLELPPAQIDDWRRRWLKATRAAPMSLDEAHEIASAFLNPILDGSARGEWSPADRAWTG